MRGLLSEDMKVVSILDGLGTAAADDRKSEVIDTAGYGRCLIVVKHLALAGTQTMTLQSSDAVTDQDTLDTGSDVAGSSQEIAGTDDNKVNAYEFVPDNRYYQLTVDKTVAESSDEVAFAILYQAKSKPATHGLGTSAVGEGTSAVSAVNLGLATRGTA